MPRIHELVKVRPEVTEGDLHGIVSLFALLTEEEDVFEKDAARVLAATYPSEALRVLLHRLKSSLAAGDADRKGNFIVSGGYGSGKSHLLLVLYHILNNPKLAAPWLSAHDIDFESPDDAIAILLPMNQITMPGKDSVEYLWEPIFLQLGYTGFTHTGNNFPTASDLKDAVAGRRVFLIIDEVERWFMPIKDEHQAHANVTFLQNLTEFAENPSNGIINFITLLRLSPAITDIVERPEGFREDMTRAPDRRQIVLHRLVEAVDRDGAAAVADAYLGQYQQLRSHIDIADYGKYRDEMLTCYPFHPATIQTVFDQYSSVARQEESSYQNSRGALYLLAHVLREAVPTGHHNAGFLANADLVLPGDISLANDRLADDLQALNPRLVDIAQSNIQTSQEVEHAPAILSTILLHSLSQKAGQQAVGAELGDILLGTIRPPESTAGAISPNGILASLKKLDDTALNLHQLENPPRWLLDPTVNVQGKINARARTDAIGEKAQEEVVGALRQLVGGSVSVFPHEEIPDVRDITLVISTRYLENDDIVRDIYYGKANPNGLVIVMPLSHGSLFDDRDLMWQAREKLAAEQIRKEMMAAGQEIPSLLSHKAAGTALSESLPHRYGNWMAPFYDATTNELSFRRYAVKLDEGSILKAVGDRYDTGRFERNVMESVRSRGGTPPTVADIRNDFYRQKSYAKPVAGGHVTDTPIDDAIRALVKKAELEVIQSGDAHYICGKDPNTLDKSWRIGIPPEEHKPTFNLTEAIVKTLRSKGAKGATVNEVRFTCEQFEADFPGTELDDATVDARLRELVQQGQVETVGAAGDVKAPLDPGLTVRMLQVGPGPGKIYVELPPMSPQQAKTKVVQEVGKTDKLSDVRVDLTQWLKYEDLKAGAGAVLGLKEAQITASTQVEVSYHLSGTPITSRDALVELLNGMPQGGDAKATVRFQKVATPTAGEAWPPQETAPTLPLT